MTNTQKFYLNDIMGAHFFDTQDLNTDVWFLDDNGEWFTTDAEEAAWFEDLANAYDVTDEAEVIEMAGYCNDYDDIIAYAQSLEVA